jgi:hypothetical protein
VKLAKHYQDVTMIQEDDNEDIQTTDDTATFNWIDGADEPKVIQTNLMQKSNPLEHQVIENPEPSTFEWVNAPSMMAQQAKAPEADDIETAQDEEK